jgi:hypothetical protein
MLLGLTFHFKIKNIFLKKIYNKHYQNYKIDFFSQKSQKQRHP